MGQEKLYDSFGRVHDYLRISLTEKCNLRCFYCMPADGVPLKPRSHYMTADEIRGIAEAFVRLGVNKIRLTGGEPLVRKDAGDIVRALGKLPVELAITTNGVLVHRFLEAFREAGLKTINLSFDAPDNARFEQITRRKQAEKVRENIRMLLGEGFRVKVNMVVIRGINDDVLPEMVAWTKAYPLEVRFIEYMPFGGNEWDKERLVPYAEMLERIREGSGEGSDAIIRLSDAPHDTAQNYALPDGVGTFAVIPPVTRPFCDTCNRLRLTANGHMKNCLFSDSEIDLLTIYRNGGDLSGPIREGLMKKAWMRGGMDTFDSLSDPEKHGKNRSMVSIGG